MQTIPDSVLEKIRTHRPQLGRIIENLKAFPARAVQFEKAIADNYCMGETRLGALESWPVGQPGRSFGAHRGNGRFSGGGQLSTPAPRGSFQNSTN